jgi:site-specific recombinase XerD
MVYGLRYYYRLLGMNKNAIALPSLKKDTKLPVILNHQELKELFAAPTLLKQRVVLTLIYSAGLRGQEVINLKISDVDASASSVQDLSDEPFIFVRANTRKTGLFRWRKVWQSG